MENQSSRSLYQLKAGSTAQIKEIQTDARMAAKLAAMGIVRGQFITRKKGSSPVVVSVSGTEVAIGRETAKKILVTAKKNTFLLAGNPNVGKSLIFSRLTGIGIISSNLENYLNGIIEEWVDWIRDNGGSRVKTYADIIDYLYEDILDDYMISDNIENDEIKRQVRYVVANYEPNDFENRRDLEIYVIRI